MDDACCLPSPGTANASPREISRVRQPITRTIHTQTPNPLPNPRSLVPVFPTPASHPSAEHPAHRLACLSIPHPPTSATSIVIQTSQNLLLPVITTAAASAAAVTRRGWFTTNERRWNCHALSTRVLWLVFPGNVHDTASQQLSLLAMSTRRC